MQHRVLIVLGLFLSVTGCGPLAVVRPLPSRSEWEQAYDRGLVAMAFGKIRKGDLFRRKLTHAETNPPLVKPHPRDSHSQASNEKPSGLSGQMKAPTKPLVYVYGTADFPLPRKIICPACIAFQAWHDQLTVPQREALPVRFDYVSDAQRIPRAAFDWARPAFHWIGNDGRGWKTEGWRGIDHFLETWRQTPGDALTGTRPGEHPSVGAAVSSISWEYVKLLLSYVGQGEVALSPQASLRIPAQIGVQIQRTGDTVTAELSEPYPVIRYRTWGLRFDDTLRGATVNPQQAAVRLGTYGTVKFAVE